MECSGVYIVNNQEYNLFNLKLLCNSRLYLTSHDWERDLYTFILEFLSEKSTIGLTTSGSTGSPKTILVEKCKMVVSAKMTASYFDLKEGDSVLLCLPVSYVAGKMMVVRALVNGLNLIVHQPSMTPLKALLASDKIDFAAMVPSQLKEFSQSDLGLIKKLILGGAKVEDDLVRRLQGVSTAVYETYGMTETLSHVAVKQLNGAYKSSVFKALPGVSFSKDDRQCLRIKANDLLLSELQTNDIVELVDATSFTWLGRFDNVINSGGIKVIPEKVEEGIKTIFNELEIANRFFVGGIPCEKLGEKVILIIEGELNFKVDLLSVIKEKVNKYEAPKGLYSVDFFEETNSSKLKRRAIIQKLTSKLKL